MPERVLRANGLTVIIRPMARAGAELLAEPGPVPARTVRAALDGARSRVLAKDVDDDSDGPRRSPPPSPTTTTGRSSLQVPSKIPAQPRRHPPRLSRSPMPTSSTKRSMCSAATTRSQRLSSGDLVAYPAMPPLANVTRPDGTVERAVTLGPHTSGDGPVAHALGERLPSSEPPLAWGATPPH